MSGVPPSMVPQKTSSATGSTLPFNHKEVDDLVMWKDPKRSAAVVVVATAAYWTLCCGTVKIAWLVSVLALAVVAISAVWGQTGPWFKSAGPPVPKFLLEGFSADEAARLVESVRKPLNSALGLLGAVLAGRDLKSSGLIAGCLLVAVYVFRFVSLFTLSYAALILAFAVPKLYEMNKEKVDSLVGQLTHKSKAMYGQLEDKVRAPKKAM